MGYYFDDPNRQVRLKQILESWVGTPFRHRCGVKGLGADCIHFVARVFEELGVIRWRADMIPDYPPDWNLHKTRELLCEAIEREAKVEKFEIDDPFRWNFKNGDIVCSYYGKAASHAGIFCDGYVYQTLEDMGVIKTHLEDDYFIRRIKIVYRILE